MPAQIGRFSRLASVRVLPDRGSCAVCGGPLSSHHPKRGLRPAHPAIQYRRGTSRTGELDGEKEINGG
jgi:rRNA maturation protein Nop10